MNVTICCSRMDPQPWLAGLQAALPHARVQVWQPGDAPADYAVVWQPPQAFIDAQPRLKALFNMGAGVDALLRLRLPEGLPVVRLEDAGMGRQMVDYVLQAVLRHARGWAADEARMRAGRWEVQPYTPLSDYPVGVMGLGVLGAQVAQALAAAGFAVRGWSRSPKAVAGVECLHGEAGWKPFLQGARVLVNLLPLTPQTQDILNRTTFEQLPRGAYLVNVARGAHLVEEDLLEALAQGQLSGATLDVFRTEPLPEGHPFWQEPRITMTPHVSARSLVEESIAQIAAKLRAFDQGERVSGHVDVRNGY